MFLSLVQIRADILKLKKLLTEALSSINGKKLEIIASISILKILLLGFIIFFIG